MIAMNRQGAVVEYDWPANSFALLGGKLIAVSDTGIIEIGGADDAGTEIASSATTGLMDGDSPMKKVSTDAYLHIRTDQPLRFSAYFNGDWYDYPLVRLRTTELASHKANLGRGLRSVYHQFRWENVKGGEFTLNSVRVLIDILSTGR